MSEARKGKGMSKTDLAEASGVSGATVTEWENGNIKRLDAENLLRSCQALGVSPYWLMFGVEGGAETIPAVEKRDKLNARAERIARRLEALPDDKLKAFEIVLGVKLLD
jgi:transcriptional regulator with XRE-family HTH domain